MLCAFDFGMWTRRHALAGLAGALVLLPSGASQAGWFSDLFKRSPKSEHVKPEHVKPAAPARTVVLPKTVPAARSIAVRKPEEPARSGVADKSDLAKTGAARCEPAKFRLVVDVGHTRKSDGAISARNVPEFDFNLRLATRIVEKLKSDGFVGTRLMVTEGKARPSLIRRVATANNSRADLFLSIHHDSVPDKFMDNWEFDGRKGHFSDRFSGWSLFVSRSNANYDASLAFARLIGKRLKSDGLKFADQYTLPVMGKYRHDLLDKTAGVYRYDHLVVLMKTEMPAVLLEAGSIINRDEELAMASPERQDLIIGAVTTAVRDYCGPLPAPKPEEPLLTANH